MGKKYGHLDLEHTFDNRKIDDVSVKEIKYEEYYLQRKIIRQIVQSF